MNNPSSSHAHKVEGLFSHIAGVYDILNRVFSLGIDALWRKYLAVAVSSSLSQQKTACLDLAAGTLEVTVELAKKYPETQIIAMDFCKPMLKHGLKKITSCKNVSVAVGDATHLPLADNSVDAITIAFGLRNFAPRGAALQESLRVLKPGGTLAVLEFGSARDRIMFGLYNWYLAHVLPLVGRLVSKDKGAYRYLADTIAAFPSADELVQEFQSAGFFEVRYTRYTAGIVCIHTGVKR